MSYRVCPSTTCCTLHNFIRLADRNNVFFENAPHGELPNGGDYTHRYDLCDAAALAMTNMRDEIAQLMWDSIHPPN